MVFKYSINKIEENMSKAVGLDLPISFKQSFEICNYIRKNDVAKAKIKLEDAISQKRPIPFRKFTNGLGHKKGNLLAGRYPIKACTEILKLINSAESNALFKGLNSKGLVICHISVKNAASAWHYGRQKRRRMKRCHIEVILKESSLKNNSVKKDNNAQKKVKVEETNKNNNQNNNQNKLENNVIEKDVVNNKSTELVKKQQTSVLNKNDVSKEKNVQNVKTEKNIIETENKIHNKSDNKSKNESELNKNKVKEE
jgi:large subunit ribosomal protein L22